MLDVAASDLDAPGVLVVDPAVRDLCHPPITRRHHIVDLCGHPGERVHLASHAVLVLRLTGVDEVVRSSDDVGPAEGVDRQSMLANVALAATERVVGAARLREGSPVVSRACACASRSAPVVVAISPYPQPSGSWLA